MAITMNIDPRITAALDKRKAAAAAAQAKKAANQASLPTIPGLPSGSNPNPLAAGGSTGSGGSSSGLSAFGVNLSSPGAAPMGAFNSSDPNSIIGAVTSAQNNANAANNSRYNQQLGVLTGGMQGGDAIFDNERNRINQQATNTSSAATQSAVSRGLYNTSILNSLQDQVTRSKDNALTGVAAQQAAANQQNAQVLSSTIGNRNDVAPSIGEYAPLISSAMAAKNSGGRSVTTNTNPVPINSPIYGGGGGGAYTPNPVQAPGYSGLASGYGGNYNQQGYGYSPAATPNTQPAAGPLPPGFSWMYGNKPNYVAGTLDETLPIPGLISSLYA